eukprot:6265349-Amphidinium_carterae.5
MIPLCNASDLSAAKRQASAQNTSRYQMVELASTHETSAHSCALPQDWRRHRRGFFFQALSLNSKARTVPIVQTRLVAEWSAQCRLLHKQA